jgi:hypothetical protein
MAKKRHWLKWPGLLLVIMLVAVAFSQAGQALATEIMFPDQTVISQVYDQQGQSASRDTGTSASLLLSGADDTMVQSVNSQVYNQPDQILLTWTADPQTSQTVGWRVYGADSSEIQYLPQSGSTDDFNGALKQDVQGSQLYDGYNYFAAELADLQPGTTYVYRVGTDGCWSEPATFTTGADTDNFSFMFMGDVHAGYNDQSAGVWQRLLANARGIYPDIKFALQAGDIVDDTNDAGEWSQLFTAAAGVFDRISLMPAEGNHESTDTALFFKYFTLPKNGPAGYEEHDYSFDYGNAHFAVLDSSMMGNGDAVAQAGLNWLQNDLQQSNKKWKFVMFHVPPYTINSGDGNDVAAAAVMRQYWVPVLERNGVDMVFVGHQHMYMRTYPLYQDRIQAGPTEGITYLMGNASNKFYINPEQHDYVAKVLTKVTSYTCLNIDGDVLTMTTRDVDGNVVDQYKINKGGVMDARVNVGNVQLLNSSYQAVSSVPVKADYRLRVHLNNYTNSVQNATAVVQVRSGSGAAAENGGQTLGISSLKTTVPVAGADVYGNFTLPDLPAGKAYVDVYVLDDTNVPIDDPYQKFSFDITAN